MHSPWLFFWVILASYLATASGHLDSPDAEIQFRTTKSMALRFSMAIAPLGEDGFASRRGPDGQDYAQYGVGMPLLAVPFYYAGAALSAVIPEAWVHRVVWPITQYHGGSTEEYLLRFGVSFFNIPVSAAASALFFALMLHLGLPAHGAWMAGLLHALGTYQWAHSRTFFSEPLAALLIFASFMLIFHWHRRIDDHPADGLSVPRPRPWMLPIWAGILAGFAVLVRKDSALFFPGLCIYATLPLVLRAGPVDRAPAATEDWRATMPLFSTARWQWQPHLFRPVALGATLLTGGMVLGLVTHFVVAWLQFGDPTSLGYEDQPEGINFSTPLFAGLYGFLFSAGKGLYFFSPALVLAAVGMWRLGRSAPRLTVGMVLVIVPFCIAMSKWQNWAGGWCWGPRHIHQIHIFLALGLAGWIASGMLAARAQAGEPSESAPSADASPAIAPFHRLWSWVFLIVGAGVQLYGSSQHAVDYYMAAYRNARQEPSLVARSLYTPGEAAEYFVLKVAPDGSRLGPVPLSQSGVTAPINDSIYVPQNGQWYGYAAMWRARIHDFLLLHVLVAMIAQR